MATATTYTNLTGASYVDLGPGPVIVTALRGTVSLVVADESNAAPADADSGFVIGSADAPISIDTTSHVWGKTTSGNVSSHVLVAPLKKNKLQVNASSGVVAAAVATATLAADVARKNFLTGFEISGGGATAASLVTGTITGVVGGPISFIVPVPAGVAAALPPISRQFNPPLQATAKNIAIAVSVPSLGAGNTAACATAYGYKE